MSAEEVTAVGEVQAAFWQAAGTPVPWWEPAWALGWAVALYFKETQDAVLVQARQIRVVAWVVLKQHVGAWAAHALKGQGTWSPPQIGHTLVKAEETTTKQGTTMWVREPAASQKKRYLCHMDAACGLVACC